MAASAPPKLRPDTVTVLPVPMFLSAKAPAAEALFRVTVSPPTTPTRAALSVSSVAVVVPSYVLFAEVIPLTVSSLAVTVPVLTAV